MALAVSSQHEVSIDHRVMANAIRFLAMDAVECAKCGHPGMPMGMADVATVLFREFLKFDPKAPRWPDRDRFVLSAGHGSMLLYALLYLMGYEDMPLEELKRFRQLGSHTPGHPEYGHAAGIETTTGPLGQGLSTAVGMALAEAHLRARFGEDLVNHHTYVMASDGDLMEGISHEAISMAGHLRLNKLIVLYDDNHISIDGPTELTLSDNQLKRFEACGWNATAIDGHDPQAISRAIHQARHADRPSLIACRTQIAYGAPKKAGTSAAHGAPLGGDEVAATREALGWAFPPFEVPDTLLRAWRSLGHQTERLAWEGRLRHHAQREAFEWTLSGALPGTWTSLMEGLVETLRREQPAQATRVLSQRVLETIVPHIPSLVGGSADLTGSNNTKVKSQALLTHEHYDGTYIHYGVREHAMAAVMNGLALHKGVIPYGGTFLIFSDYLKPALRLSALMEQRVIYVLTHDSIGLGEDGPTHQPIEHLAALRAIPNLNVFRPADGVEVAECWALALESQTTPSVIALTRQAILPVRKDHANENWCARGAYILRQAPAPRLATLFATGSEVGLAVEAHDRLAVQEIPTCVVSVPCWRLFDLQPEGYRSTVLGPKDGLRVAIEAASPFGWGRFIGEDGVMIGMTTFGASAPSHDLYPHFNITVEAIVKKVLHHLGRAP